jgi:hypothetical protein
LGNRRIGEGWYSKTVFERWVGKIESAEHLRRVSVIDQTWANEFAIDVHVGVNTIGILYRSIGRRRVIEMLTFKK